MQNHIPTEQRTKNITKWYVRVRIRGEKCLQDFHVSPINTRPPARTQTNETLSQKRKRALGFCLIVATNIKKCMWITITPADKWESINTTQYNTTQHDAFLASPRTGNKNSTPRDVDVIHMSWDIDTAVPDEPNISQLLFIIACLHSTLLHRSS